MLAAIASAAATACRKIDTPSREPSPDRWQELAFGESPVTPGGQRALVFTPSSRAPLVVALPGRGASGRGLDAGARGFRDDYSFTHAHDRLLAPPLTAQDLAGFTTPGRLGELNASLRATPFQGLRLATPYTPDLADRSIAGAEGFARFVAEALLPRAAAISGALLERARTGIDGISMGGRLALFLGLTRPDLFASVGALQPAIRASDVELIVGLARAATESHAVALRIASSEDDPFLPAVRALSSGLDAARVKHRLIVVPGPHDYAWNRGPGNVELLMFHERVLRGLPAP
jgi:hypothetical protein